jgi:prepilin peptidase CpaA
MPKFGIEIVFAASSLFCAALSSVYDVRSRRIPNAITFPAMVFGLILHGTLGGWRQLLAAGTGGLICGVIFLVFYLAGGMGAGDVKLITAAGCIAGLPLIGRLLLWTALAGGVMAIGLAIYRGRLVTTVRNMWTIVLHHRVMGLTPHAQFNLSNDRALRLPYALAITAGSALTLCLLAIER